MEKRKASHPQKPHATSQPLRFSHTHQRSLPCAFPHESMKQPAIISMQQAPLTVSLFPPVVPCTHIVAVPVAQQHQFIVPA